VGFLHAFFPGPTSIGNDGFDIEPSTITNFKGFTGVAMLAGTATDANGNSFTLASDIRVSQGEYVSADGKRHHGTFVLIWIDLFEPSLGQVHDFNATILPSGLFWTTQVPDSALTIDEDSVRLHLENVGVVDNLTFGGSGQTFSLVNIDVTWSPFGDVQHFRPGSSVPTDPTNFAGRFRFANADAILSGSQSGFSFSSTDASSVGVFAEVGRERNGILLNNDDDWSSWLG
jgi:hypothetical protein